MTTIKILVAGIGGVGGYFGGLLAKYFQDRQDGEVYFLARGKHLAAIQELGLTVVAGQKEFIAKPKLATDKPKEIGIVDCVIVCTKSYDLEETLEQLLPCINDQTVILPLLNGVDSRARIKKRLPNNLVCDGCVYIISRLSLPGRVENLGNIQKLFFGAQGQSDTRLELLEDVFKQAGIESTLSSNIETIIWEKFIFISAMAMVTTYFDESVGPILSDKAKRRTIKQLVQENVAVAQQKGISIASEISEKVLAKLESLPPEATSSLHSDFQSESPKTEIQSLIGYVVAEGQNLNIETPVYNQLFLEIKSKVS